MPNNLLLGSVSAAVLATIVAGTIYVCVQQSYRSGANDPQLQIARDMRDKIKRNGPSAWAVPSDTVDISRSLAVFTALYDNSGKPLQSNALLDGEMPVLPSGVLDNARKKGEHKVTWQPRQGVRMATVIEFVDSPTVAFVASGRSLQEVEQRVSNLITLIIGGWLASIGVIILYYLGSIALRPGKDDNSRYRAIKGVVETK